MRRAVLGVLAIGSLGMLCFAQDALTPRKYSNVSWFEVMNIDYLPGKTAEAMGMIYDHFVPAARSAGLPPARILEYSTGGEWDVMLVFRMPDGPADLEWEIRPDSVKWRKALADQEGSMEAAEELLDQYSALINRATFQIAHERNREMIAQPDEE